MNTLVFVSIAVMKCYGSVLTPQYGALQRCNFSHETIVKAESLSRLTDKRYFLGPISMSMQAGCSVTLTNGETLVSGKPCRNLVGEKQ